MSAADFVQLVGQYPCIYNSDLPDYARKGTTEKAWQEVANTMEWTVTECKDKWKNIRNGFVRSLKPSYKGGAKKPYYLCDELQFLIPYINPSTNILTEKLRMPSPNDEAEEVHFEEYKQENEIEIEVSPAAVVRPSRKRKAPENETATSDVDNALVTWLENKKTSMEDTRKMFLFSLLPDLRSLNDEQLAVFRIKMLLLLEEVKTLSGDNLKEMLNQMK